MSIWQQPSRMLNVSEMVHVDDGTNREESIDTEDTNEHNTTFVHDTPIEDVETPTLQDKPVVIDLTSVSENENGDTIVPISKVETQTSYQKPLDALFSQVDPNKRRVLYDNLTKLHHKKISNDEFSKRMQEIAGIEFTKQFVSIITPSAKKATTVARSDPNETLNALFRQVDEHMRKTLYANLQTFYRHDISEDELFKRMTMLAGEDFVKEFMLRMPAFPSRSPASIETPPKSSEPVMKNPSNSEVRPLDALFSQVEPIKRRTLYANLTKLYRREISRNELVEKISEIAGRAFTEQYLLIIQLDKKMPFHSPDEHPKITVEPHIKDILLIYLKAFHRNEITKDALLKNMTRLVGEHFTKEFLVEIGKIKPLVEDLNVKTLIHSLAISNLIEQKPSNPTAVTKMIPSERSNQCNSIVTEGERELCCDKVLEAVIKVRPNAPLTAMQNWVIKVESDVLRDTTTRSDYVIKLQKKVRNAIKDAQ